MAIEDPDIDDIDSKHEADRKQRNAARLQDDEMMVWMLFAAASMSGGKPTRDASSAADAMMENMKRRFT